MNVGTVIKESEYKRICNEKLRVWAFGLGNCGLTQFSCGYTNLGYQNRRSDHLAAMWQIVNWDVVEQRNN